MSEELTQHPLGRLFLLNPDSILGLMMFSVVLSVQDDNVAPFELIIVSLAGVFALWVAHVFAHTIAGHSVTEDQSVSLGHAFRASVHDAMPMFLWPAPSAVVLLIAPLTGVSTTVSVNLSLVVMFATLFLFGYLVFRYRRRSVSTRILGGLATALVGMIVIGVELLVRYLH
jgi:hypothetical protein